MVAYRSVSVPMTLSDLERRDARGHIFRRISLITFVLFDLERPNTARRGMLPEVSHTLPQDGGATHLTW